MKEREGLMDKRTEILPDVTTFPKIDKVQFRLPERPSAKYDDKNPIPKNLKFVNDRGIDDINKIKTKVNIFDADYLNQVNTKRLDDLKQLDTRGETHKDILSEYLDRETKAATITLHESDARNELMNKDILLPFDKPSYDNYETPLKVVSKYKEFPSIDDLTLEIEKSRQPLSQKLILRSYSKA